MKRIKMTEKQVLGAIKELKTLSSRNSSICIRFDEKHVLNYKLFTSAILRLERYMELGLLPEEICVYGLAASNKKNWKIL
jgi:hypothetical protein